MSTLPERVYEDSSDGGRIVSILGMPVEMFLVFVGTIVAGSIGAIHYLVVHKLLGKPFPETEPNAEPEVE